MVINALICDDEQKYIEQIQKCLSDYCYDHSITYHIDTFANGMLAIHSPNAYNIAFLDIEIDNVVVFFITAYEKYIDDAMDLFALRFIKKPIDNMRLYGGIDKAVELINEDEISFFLKFSDTAVKIRANEIMYIEIGDHKTIIFTENNNYESSENLDYWEHKLTNVCFSRPHKSFILNMEYVDKYKRNEVTLKNGKIIPIAYRNQKDFRKIFWDYLKRRK